MEPPSSPAGEVSARSTQSSYLLPAASELRALFALALPVALVQVGLMAMGVVDSIMVGHVSAADLAAVALGNLYVFGSCGFGL